MTDANAQILETALSTVASRAPSHDTPDGGKIVVLPDGYRAERVAPLEPKLTRVKQAVTLHDAASFVAYVKRYKTDSTRIFAEPGFLAGGQAHVTAVFDYHMPGTPDYGVHSAKYCPRYSDQWQRWQAACAGQIKQAEFAEFVEEVRADIREPEAAKLLDVVRTFKASKKVDFDSVAYQPNGDVRLVYDERTSQTGSSGTLPETMKLGIPVYFRGEVYAVPVFIRYRVGQGAVMFQLKLDRANLIEDAAFMELATKIGEEVSIDVYLGRR